MQIIFSILFLVVLFALLLQFLRAVAILLLAILLCLFGWIFKIVTCLFNLWCGLWNTAFPKR